jgi:hypothetical protein
VWTTYHSVPTNAGGEVVPVGRLPMHSAGAETRLIQRYRERGA